METQFTIQSPNKEAAALLLGKKPVTADVFYGLLPELRGRAFTISGVEGASVLQRCRDHIAGIALGENWDDAKARLIDELDPFLGDGSERRAELLLRNQGFQAFQASAWRTSQLDDDTTHLQYLTMEDDRVRDSHTALNGIVLPKDDPFWRSHTPPWDWNCRCQVVPMNPDQVAEEKAADQKRNPEDRNVLEGAVADQARMGTLIRGGQRYSVLPDERAGAWHWDPRDLRLPIGELALRYDPQTWQEFQHWARTHFVDDDKTTVWNWLNSAPKPKSAVDFPIDKRYAYDDARNRDRQDDLQRQDYRLDSRARVAGENAERHLRALRSRYGQAALDDQYLKQFGAEIAAVVQGVKPVFHEEFGVDLSNALAGEMRHLARSVSVQSIDGHLFIYNPRVVEKIIDHDPAFYTGSDMLQKLLHAFSGGQSGELLGYGGRSMLTPNTSLVSIYDSSTGQVFLSFKAPRDKVDFYGAQRANDYSAYLNRPVSWHVIGG
jgi:SPP1 gp7 family putative phage head morphogenesis protein